MTTNATEPRLNIVTLTLCDLCLDGKGGECHVPGCAGRRMTALAGYAWLLLLALAAGWVSCAVFGALTESSCRRGDVDFTGAAARGELLDLDWSDPRPRDTA